jgi:large subunit ribosomal protein L3
MLLGRKIGMTQIFDATGRVIPVTVVKVGPMVVVQVKSEGSREGYAAVKVGFEDAQRVEKDGVVSWKGVTRPEAGVFEKAGIEVPRRVVREFRVNEAELAAYTVGQILDHSMFAEGESIDVTGNTKGRGTTGVMKRHNFSGFNSSHGAHETFRGPGSIGAHTFPARVFPGKKMAGRYGNERMTIENLKIVRIDAEDGLYLIRGSVPGANGGLVMVRPAVKSGGRKGR